MIMFDEIKALINNLEKLNKELKEENEELKKKLNQKTSDYDDLDSLGCHGLSDW